MALVSIVVPVYNIENYIDKCIESIRNQSYHELQILLVDDGSKDASSTICDKHGEEDPRITVIHKENGGLSDARNTGIREAKGEYIAFVDGDDSISFDYVQICMEEVTKRNADLLIFDYEEIEEETGRRDIWQMNMKRGKVMNLKNEPKLLFTTPSACNKFFKTTLFKEHNISFPYRRTFEDLATIPKILDLASRVVYLDCKPLYYYNLRQGSIMRSNQFDKSFENRTKAFEDIEDYFREKEPGRYQKELEYLCLLHCYFIPSKEIVYSKGDEKYLKKFKDYAFNKYPGLVKNPYIKTELGKKDKILLTCLKLNQYKLMTGLSKARMYIDKRRKDTRNE